MDYLNPNDIMKVSGLGPRDFAIVKYLYSANGSDDALGALKAFPLCGDGDVQMDPSCNQHVRGGMQPLQLIDWYLNGIVTGAPSVTPFDLRTVGVVMKAMYALPAADGLAAMEKLFVLDSEKPQKVVDYVEGLGRYGRSTRQVFLEMPIERRQAVITFLGNLVTNPTLKLQLPQQKELVSLIAGYRDQMAFIELTEVMNAITTRISQATDFDELTSLHKLEAVLVGTLNTFWNE